MSTDSQANFWTAKQALSMALISLCLGVGFGYIAHGPAKDHAAVPGSSVVNAVREGAQPEAVAPPIETENVSPEQLKQASVKAAGSALEQLQHDPKNFKLLVQVGDMYYHHRSYDEAGKYYERALAVQDNDALRGQYASALFYVGNSDAALDQYAKVLKKNPKNDIALFNTGMILMKSKNDRKGAVEAWQRLLKEFPNHPHRDQVQRMIDQASKQPA